ncbi:MAG: hypothetical protein FMNOHCHN_00698 [Ignavibacteriaceae bacterium]|nr:hypothetical protein [Ignavibacteriaceae bacterium]
MIKRFLVIVLMMVLSISCNEDTTVGPETPGGGTTVSIILLAPAGGESYKAGESRPIRWTSNTTNNIKIEFSSDGGTTFQTIAASVANLGIYNWTVPNTPSAICLIRVSDASNASVNDVTDNFFSIVTNVQKTLTLIRPNGGDTLIAGSSYQVQWTSANVANVSLSWSSDNGVSWNVIANSYPADSAKYTWSPVPNIISSDCRFKITETGTDTVADVSDNRFTIRNSQAVTVLSPNSGETLIKGSSHIIAWTATDISSVKIEYSTNDGSTWSTITASTTNDGSFDWNPIPNISTDQARIRISDAADGTPFDISDGPFSIADQPSISVLTPGNGETLTAGSRVSITWSSTGKSSRGEDEVRVNKQGNQSLVNNVSIAYSTNNGVSWISIVSSIPNTGSYSWDPVPNTVTSTGKIRVRDVSDTTVFGLSPGSFSIVPAPVKSVTVLTPNGGEVWGAGTDQFITWNSSNITYVRIELSTNGGQSWSTLASNIEASNGSYAWLGIPSTPSQNCKIRISESPVASVTDQSDNAFTIAPQQYITLTAPDGGEVLTTGGSSNITWVSENIENVKLEYTTNNGFTWSVITNSTESDGFFTWTPVPEVFSTNCRVRISDASDGVPSDVSNGIFSILAEPEIKVTAPNGGERIQSGSVYEIKWVTSTPGGSSRSSGRNTVKENDNPGVQNVRIEFSTDGGAVWSNITASVPNNGVYIWNPVPNISSALCKIRISDAADGYPTDQSDSAFVVFNQSVQQITITAPNGGEQLTAGGVTGISWTSTGVSAVNIEFTTNNGVNWSSVAANIPSTGFYSWNPVPVVSSNNCRIRISDAVDSIPSVTSASTFTILPQPTVSVLSPSGGEVLYSGTTHTIRWTSEGLPKVKLELTTNNGSAWTVITDSTESDGSYEWTVPSLASSLCKIRVSAPQGGIPSSVSNAVFTITNTLPQSIQVVKPNGGETFYAGVPNQITWTSSGVDTVKIEYSTNNGVNWLTVVNKTASSGSYIWSNLPALTSANAKIRISDAADATPSDESDAVFTIAVEPQLQVTAPNGGESILAGSAYAITWSTILSKSAETITAVNIEFSTDAGLNWSQLAQSVPNTGTYSWNPVPNISSTTCRIKISDAADGVPADMSDSNFTVYNVSLQSITVTAPNGGEVLQPGTSFNITWNSSGISFVNIELTTNNGLNWSTIAANTESDGFFQWVPASTIASTNCKVRIYDAVDSLPVDESNATFTILQSPTVTVLSPNGGEQLTAGAPYLIQWNSQNIGAVKIAFSSNNGATWNSIIDSTESDGQYIWTVPNVSSALCKIRISNQTDGFPQDESDNSFSITTASPQSITVTSPNGGENYSAGSAQVINWTSSGVDSVKIEYTTNNGVNWTVIAGSTESDGSYLWSPLPSVTSANMKVRISDASDGVPSDESDAVFSIAPDPVIAVLSPNGSEIWRTGSVENITWNSSNLDSVRIEFTTNNGATWTLIAAKAPSSGIYQWTIPNLNSQLCKVRISDPADGVPSDISDDNFTITSAVLQSISVTKPNGSEIITSGVPYEITWNNSGLDSVKIEYTTNNGQTWSVIVSGTQPDGSYFWTTVPAINSSNAKIRVSDAFDGTPVDESDAVFTIRTEPTLTLTAPNGGDSILAGSVYTITWSTLLNRNIESVTAVKLEFSTDAGLTWSQIAASAPNTGSYSWNPVPNVSSTTCRIKISDAQDGVPADMSDNNFTVYNVSLQTITVNTPNGGEIIQPGSTFNITWSSSGIANVTIELTTNNGLTWSSIVSNTPSDGLHPWTPASGISSTNCKIRIYDAADSIPSDASNAAFTIISSPALNILSPNGGEVYTAGSQQTVTWTSQNVANVKIEFTSNNGATWDEVIASTPSDGVHQWTVPAGISSVLCKIRVSDAVNGSPSDVSEEVFTVVPAQSVTVTSPNGGETLITGTNQVITWTSTEIDFVKIEYTTNNGVNWTAISASTESDGSYLWSPVPSVITTNAKIRISDASDGTPADQSDAVFSISADPVVEVISPNGGETLLTGAVQNILWSSSNLDNVKIEFTTNNGSSWTVIAATTPSTGTYAWTVPNVNSLLCKVRISDPADGEPFDISNGSFTISNVPVQTVRVSSPNGGETVTSGIPYETTWNNSGLDSVKIEYTTNNGQTWSTIVSGTQPDGSYFWTNVPATNSSNAKIRISDAADGTPTDESDAVFTIRTEPVLTLTAPNGGDSILAGSVYTITWSTALSRMTESITAVKLEFSTNSGLTWSQITNSAPNTGSYSWNPVPNVSSTTCRIKISDAVDGSPADMSDNNFTVYNVAQQSVTVTAPNGGEIIQPGSTYNITWSSSGISSVGIQLTTNNGLTWSTIISSTESDGFYQWVPASSIASTNCKVRIYDATDSLPVDESNASFTILASPAVTVLTPNGGEALNSGSQYAITWNSQSIEKVKIEFTSNNGASWTFIDSVTSNGQYLWTVPAVTSVLCKIRVSDLANGFPQDVSDEVFSVTTAAPQSITITSPNGGEVLASGANRLISWTSSGVDFVEIEYTTNNGVDWNTITATTESDGAYLWSPVPSVVTNNARIRISDAADGTPEDLSDAVFSIAPDPAVEVLYPDGGETFLSGSVQNILWSSSNLDNVKIEFTTNNGSSWTVIAATTPSTGTYAWTVPNVNSLLCKIRISDPADGEPFDISNGSFTISNVPVQTVRVSSPNGGETVTSGIPYEITWNNSGLDSVKIEYTTNNGQTWSTIVSGTQPDGSFFWTTVPSVNSSNAKIRVSDAFDGTPVDESDAVFTIRTEPTLTLTAPNGGDSILAGSVYTITWSTLLNRNIESVTAVKLEFSTDAGLTWSQIAASAPNTGSYSWNPVPNVSSTTCRIKISDAQDGVPADMSDNNFTVYNVSLQTISVNTPNGGEIIQPGSTFNITWSSSGIANVTIELTTNNGLTWSSIVSNTPSDGLHQWVPASGISSTNCKIRIYDASDNTPVDESNAAFTIISAPAVSVLSPNGGEQYSAGSSQLITWNSQGIEKVKIEFTSNNGASWTFVDSVTSNGQYLWTVSSVTSSLCKIRISDLTNGFPVDESDEVFSIATSSPQSITVTSPNGGETYASGSNQFIAWTSSGVDSVKIEYTTNNGVDWTTISAGTESDGSYLWTPVPSVQTNNAKIRISDKSDGAPSDESDAVFSIAPNPFVTVTAPNGAESLIGGSDYIIRWTSGNLANVKIEFTSDNGASWNTVIASTASTGSYVWTVPNVTSELCKIRISDPADGEPQDISDNMFSISVTSPQTITVTAPDGGESFPTGLSQVITWTSTGVSNVEIEYTTNNGVSWTTITASTESDGYYVWNSIPAVTSNNCKIRISDAADGTPSDESDAVFSIAPEPAITVFTPNGGELWSFGTSQAITWSSENLEKVKIEFTTNNGFTWTTIVDSLASTGTYSWSIPNLNSSLCRVRISDYADGVPFDISNNNFTLTNQIQQTLTVTSPNGGESFESTSSQSITWLSAAVNKVKIEYTTNNGLTWLVIVDSTESDGLYEWNPLPSVTSTLCKVRISDLADGSPVDESDAAFSITPVKSITVTYPNGGENLIAGTLYNITWTSQGVSNVRIEFRIGNTGDYEAIVESTPSDGSYEWSPSIPASFYKLRISNAEGTTPSDESNGTFTVLDEPSINLLTPDGGQSLIAGEQYNITWISEGLSNVSIELTTNNGASWTVIVDSTESDGIYTWTVDTVNSALCKIRISDEADGLPADQSAAVFQISPAITQSVTVTYPNGGEALPAGSAANITWISTGIDSVKIEYSTNNGQNWITISSGVSASGIYSWNPVPATISGNCLIRISDKNDGFPFDVSDGVFSITSESAIRVLSPNGGNNFLAGTSQQVRWTSQNVTNVDLHYTTNNGASWDTIRTGIPSSGVYIWSIPAGLNTEQGRVRVRDAADGSPFDESDSNFTIASDPYIRVTFPNGGEFIVSDTVITWISVGVQNVNIEYSLDNGVTGWNTIVANTPSTGAYRWTYIGQLSANARIRITSTADASISDMNDAPFNIGFDYGRPVILNSASEVWNQNESYNLRWMSETAGAVKIEYSSDNGMNWNVLAERYDSKSGENSFAAEHRSFSSRRVLFRITNLERGLTSVSPPVELK